LLAQLHIASADHCSNPSVCVKSLLAKSHIASAELYMIEV
jgi:hypothetical protein